MKPATSFPKNTINGRLEGVGRVIYLDAVESTQDVAKVLAVDGEPQGTVIIAGCQTKGRGRLERLWDSPAGGLYMSVVLKPVSSAQSLGRLSLVTAEAAAEAASIAYNIQTKVKAPNDVLAYQPKRKKYLKLAGILIESACQNGKTDWAVTGIGLNLNNKLPDNLKDAVSVAQITGRPALPEDFLVLFFKKFWSRYAEWEASAISRLN